jgi:hypothetical protein
LQAYENELFSFIEKNHNEFVQKLLKEGKFTSELEETANTILSEFSKIFMPEHAPDDIDAGDMETVEKLCADDVRKG